MKRGSIDLARSLCVEIAGATDENDGDNYGSVDIAEILSAEVERLRADNAVLRRRETYITGLLQEQMERAEKAEADNAALREQVAALSKPVTKSDAAVVAKQLRAWSDADLRAESKVRDVSKANREATLGYIAASVLESLDRTTDILADRAEKAEAENAALKQDAERLDWLDANWDSAFVAKTDKGYLPWADNVDYQLTLRAAIDAAIAKDKQTCSTP